MNTRENSLDLLRVLATIAVIFIHVNYCYFSTRAEMPMLDVYYVMESLLNIVTRFSVPIFVMLSGAFILHDENNKNFGVFYRKTGYKIGLPTIAVILFLFLMSECKQLFMGEDWRRPLKDVITGSFYNMWYMYMLCFLYIAAPLIIRLKLSVGKERFRIITYILLIWAVISQATSSYKLAYDLGVVSAFLSYFMMGNVIYENFSGGV